MIQARLAKKDKNELKAGPYHEYLVLVYTDEPSISLSVARAWLKGHRFASPANIGRSHFALSYDPQTGNSPSIRLEW